MGAERSTSRPAAPVDASDTRTRGFLCILTCVFFVPFVSFAEIALSETTLRLDAPAEVIATIRAACQRCEWGAAGREGASLEVKVDAEYHSHLMLVRGREEAAYRILLGHVDRGQHRVTVAVDRAKSPAGIGSVRVRDISFDIVAEQDPRYEAVAHAPILYARPNTIGHFTDVPLLMWYESAATPAGRRYRYSVIFSNEDGGTATDRLMATWGRTTDIEFVYGIEVDANGRTLAEEFQGPSHVVSPFRGRHDSGHPLELVITDNNMVTDAGSSGIRYAPAPEAFDLTNRSREAVMDAHPWTYRVTSEEMRREGKIADQAKAGEGVITDPRRYVFVEACSELENAALSFGVRVQGPDGPRWYDSDRDRDDFRIVRTGCFRGGVPIPPGSALPDALRFRACPRGGGGETPAAPPRVKITRVNSVFALGNDYLPAPSRFSWTGSLPLAMDGAPVELTLRRP